jgi:exosortase
MNCSWKASLSGAIVACLLSGLVLWPTGKELVEAWQMSEAYRYAWLVLPMFFYLVGWHHRIEILAGQPKPDSSGIPVAIIATIAWSFSAAASVDIGRQLSAILIIQGIALSALGWHLYWRLFPIMGLLFLMLPSADLLLDPLRLLTVKSIELFALIGNFPHRIEGYSVFIGENSYFVLDSCAGLSHVMLTFFLGYCFGLLIFRSFFKILSLALFAAFLGILSNAIRVNAIIWIDWVQGAQMNLAAHGRIQWIALILVLAMLFYVLLQLKADTAQNQSLALPSVQRSWLGAYYPVVAGLAVLAISSLVSSLLKDESPVSRNEKVAVLPENMAGWELASPAANWRTERGIETLTLSYRRYGQDLRVTVVETLSLASKLDDSLLAPNDQATWRDGRSEKLSTCVAAKCLSFVHAIWQQDQGRVVRHVYRSYSIGDFQTGSKLVLRIAKAWFRLAGRRDLPRLVGFSIDGGELRLDELASVHNAIDAALSSGNKQPSVLERPLARVFHSTDN